jgi:hypothetical protein
MSDQAFPLTDDSLQLMAAEATDLLHRVDLVIDQLGTPAQHPVNPLLRKLRVRPGDVLRMLLATPPARLMESVTQLRGLAEAYHDDLVAPLDRAARQLGWSGSGHDAFRTDWDAQLRHLAYGDSAETMAAKLRTTADFVESVAGWFSQTRRALAGALLEAFTSIEAVTLKGSDQLEGDPAALHEAIVAGRLENADRLVTAAANVAAVSLNAVEQWYDKAQEHFVAGADGVPAGGWTTKLERLPHPSGGGARPSYSEGAWVHL